MSNDVPVRPGQVWEDCDKRGYGRHVTVLSVDETHAVVKSVRKTRVRLDRFRPTSTGYRLVKDVR